MWVLLEPSTIQALPVLLKRIGNARAKTFTMSQLVTDIRAFDLRVAYEVDGRFLGHLERKRLPEVAEDLNIC